MIGNLKDSRNLIDKLTLSRLRNAMACYAGYHYSKFTGSPNVWSLPVSIAIEPTTSCNLRCPECPSGLRSFTRPTGMLQQQLFKNILDELSGTLSYLTFYFQGEPYLHPQFIELVSYAASKNIYTTTSTNAHFLNDDIARKTVESGLDRLIISIDGITQQSYEAYRVGGKLNKVIDGAKNIIKWKKELRSNTPYVVLQFLVVRQNEHEIPLIKKLGEEIGVDHVALKTAQIYDFENGSDLIPANELYSRYKKNSSGKYEIKNNMLNQCWKMWHSCVITWDGRVVPCCFDKDAHHMMGDLNHSSFKEIWYNEKYQSFRSSLLKARSEIEMCRNCTEGTKVWT